VNKAGAGGSGSIASRLVNIAREIGFVKLATTGLPARCVMIGTLTAGQFGIFDTVMNALGASKFHCEFAFAKDVALISEELTLVCAQSTTPASTKRGAWRRKVQFEDSGERLDLGINGECSSISFNSLSEIPLCSATANILVATSDTHYTSY
jgi:hypothetical protein